MSAQIWGRFVRRATAMFVTCSYQCMLRILCWHLMWKACSRVNSELVVVHVSEAYRSTGTKKDMYRCSLVVRVRCDTLQTRDMRCIVLAASPILRRYSSSVIDGTQNVQRTSWVTTWVTVREPSTELSWLPKYVKFSTPAAHPPWWSVLAGLHLCFEPLSLYTRYADQGRNRHSPCSSRWPQDSLDQYPV